MKLLSKEEWRERSLRTYTSFISAELYDAHVEILTAMRELLDGDYATRAQWRENNNAVIKRFNLAVRRFDTELRKLEK